MFFKYNCNNAVEPELRYDQQYTQFDDLTSNSFHIQQRMTSICDIIESKSCSYNDDLVRYTCLLTTPDRWKVAS